MQFSFIHVENGKKWTFKLSFSLGEISKIFVNYNK